MGTKNIGQIQTKWTCRLGGAEGPSRPSRPSPKPPSLSSEFLPWGRWCHDDEPPPSPLMRHVPRQCASKHGAGMARHVKQAQWAKPNCNYSGEFIKIKQSAHFKLEVVHTSIKRIIFLNFTCSFACLTCYSSPPAMYPCWNQNSMSFRCCGFATLSTLHILHSKSAHARNDNSLSTPIRAFNQERQSHFATLPHFEN